MGLNKKAAWGAFILKFVYHLSDLSRHSAFIGVSSVLSVPWMDLPWSGLWLIFSILPQATRLCQHVLFTHSPFAFFVPFRSGRKTGLLLP